MMTVSELTGRIKRTIEDNFFDIQIVGELSNYTAHNSGHWYFSLKDSEAQISCTMWRGNNNFVFFTPQNGMKLIVIGRVTVYPPRGAYQIDVKSMVPAGEGDLQLAFEALKKKLQSEGLFDQEYKKEIPWMPNRIGIATAIDGAALQDMIVTAKRRFPLAELVISPCKVQGVGAADSIAKAVALLNQQKDIDVIIVGRGGGSVEDLWAFNEEIVARAIFNAKIPVITGIGHEVDFSIADFVADVRAATPTAAMEAATPDITEIQGQVQVIARDMKTNLIRIIETAKSKLHRIVAFSVLAKPMQLITYRKKALEYVTYRLHESMKNYTSTIRHRIELATVKIEAHNVKRFVKKGFVLVTQHGKFVKRASGLKVNEDFSLEFYDKTLDIIRNEKK